MNSSIFAKFERSCSKVTSASLFALAFVVIVLIWILDFAFGSSITINALYTFPVLFITWFLGMRPGLAMVALCCIALEMTHWVNELNGSNLLDWFSFHVFAFGVITNQLILLTMTHFLREKMTALTIWANSDPLTKLSNRRAFITTLEHEFERARRYHHAFAIAFLDLDNFKHMNDTFGHNEGDILLQAVATSMKTNSRASDTVARLGGDEFAVLITETNPEQAAMVLSKISTAIRDNCKARQWPVGVSLGSVCFLAVPENPEIAIKMADELMYEVKKNNKNGDNHHVFTNH
ncbi:MAG: GGDEF domain-containing protein [Neisseriaceae bacterium]|nr:GGDEF domain-containing protein [Neisseriaceae bacterium]